MKTINNQIQTLGLVMISAVLLAGCGKRKETLDPKTATGKSNQNTPTEVEEVTWDTLPSVEEVAEFYKADSDFFTIKTTADIPGDLKWEDGSSEPVFSSPKAKRGGTMSIHTGDWPRTLRFVGPDASGSFRRHILDSNALALVESHPETDGYYPSIAKRWAVGKDKRTVYFELDPDARYSDGEPVRVTDFFFHFYFMRSKHIKAPWYNDYFDSEKFKNITLYNTRALSITYYKAKPDVVEKINIRPVPEHHYEEIDEDFLKDYQWVFEPTAGPYEVRKENINDGVAITLTRVQNWWASDKKFFKNRFNPDKIRVTVVREPAKVFELFRKGELDWHGMSLPEYWYEKLPNDAPEVVKGYIHKVQFYNDIPRPTWALRINCSKPLLNNRDIRQGLHHAMNWDLVNKEIFHGDYERMQTVADGYGARSNAKVKVREFSVQKAEAAFAKAGFTERGADGILHNAGGKRLSFTITTGYKRFTNLLTVLQQEAKKAGVELNLEILELTAGWKKTSEKQHEIAFGGLNNSVELYPRFFEPYHSYNAYKEKGDKLYNADGSLKEGITPKPDTNNATLTANRELDKLIKEFREAEDLDQITRLSHELIQRLHDHAGYIPAWTKPWYRVGYWRWVKWPDSFNAKQSRDWEELHVHWLDPAAKVETMAAKKNGKAFEKVVKVHDQHRK
jgi:microcin C transport system substrate-binding protein